MMIWNGISPKKIEIRISEWQCIVFSSVYLFLLRLQHLEKKIVLTQKNVKILINSNSGFNSIILKIEFRLGFRLIHIKYYDSTYGTIHLWTLLLFIVLFFAFCVFVRLELISSLSRERLNSILVRFSQRKSS